MTKNAFLNTERLIHSIKTVLACFLGLIITRWLPFESGTWIIITILVVMCAQIYVGSVLQKSWYRFLGTLVGCLLAAATIKFVGVTEVSSIIIICIASFIFSYLATGWENYAYTGMLGAVTTTIIMLNPHPTLQIALERFLEITIGLLIASVISQFILPIHARTHLRRSQAETLQQLSACYDLMRHARQETESNYQELDEQIVKSLLRQRQLAKESRREFLGSRIDLPHVMQILYAEREVLRAINFMHSALMQLSPNALALTHAEAFQLFNSQVDTALAVLSSNIQGQRKEISVPSLQPLKTIIQRTKGSYSDDDNLYLNSFLFSAEVLVRNLSEIANLFN